MFTTNVLPSAPNVWYLRLWHILIGLPWYAIRTYPPIFLIASSAAYASSQFAAHHGVFPVPFNIMQAIAFEYVYLGAIALASRKTRWFYITVASGAITSMLYIFLHSASVYGLLNDLPAFWLFIFAGVHAVPLVLVGLSYMVLFHINASEERAIAQKLAYKCECDRGFPTQQALYAHYQFCPLRRSTHNADH